MKVAVVVVEPQPQAQAATQVPPTHKTQVAPPQECNVCCEVITKPAPDKAYAEVCSDCYDNLAADYYDWLAEGGNLD